MKFEGFPKLWTLKLTPSPEFLFSSYRRFYQDEKHVTRICQEYVLLFMIERTLHFTENSSDITLEAGEWYIQVPGLLQEGRIGSPAPFYYYIHFHATGHQCGNSGMPGAGSPPEAPGMENWLVLPLRGRFDLKLYMPLFDQLEDLKRKRPEDMLGRQAVFLLLLHRLVSTTCLPTSRTKLLADQVVNYLIKNYNNHITGKELTKIFHYSEDYLARIMKRHYHITPWQYIQQLRISKAKELLSNTDQTQAAIADEIGYRDISLFYKAFRKHTGTAPGVWRQRSRGMHESKSLP